MPVPVWDGFPKQLQEPTQDGTATGVEFRHGRLACQPNLAGAGIMSSVTGPDGGRASRWTTSTRLAMIAATAGALLILVVYATMTWPTRNQDPGVGASGRFGAAPVPAVVAHAAPGTCLDWSAPDARDIRPLPCNQPHLFEVTGKADLRPDLGNAATFPDTDHWQQLKQQRCWQVALGALSGRLDPKGRFSVGAFTPSQQNWRHGDRTLYCGLQQPGPSGKLYRFTGNVAHLDQSDTYPVGRCLGINGTAVWDPVASCAQPHSVEITGQVNLADEFPGAFPPDSDQDVFLAGRCEQLTAQYAGRKGATNGKGLIAYWDTLPHSSWDAGSRQVNCKVSAQLPDGSGLAPITGSIRGTVRIGRVPAPEQNAPKTPGVPASNAR